MLFQTQKRKYTDGTTANDLWQVARRAVGTPDEYENPRDPLEGFVQTLWVSSRLTDEAQPRAQQWRQDLTNPDEGFAKCGGGVTVSAGPFSFTPTNCEDYDVWQGVIGHMRFSYGQGTYAGGNQRAIAYVAGYQMDNGVATPQNYYQFVTIQLGHVGSAEYKCTSVARGPSDGTLVARCDW